MEKRKQKNVLWFDELHRSDVNLVGGKSSSLGEMTSTMKIPVPYGFATTTHAYRQFMAETGLNDQINKLLAEINDYENADELHRVCSHIRQMIVEAPMPSEIAMTIKKAYAALSEKMGETEPFVAIRSSATAEDLPNASFAGQQESYLNVRGASRYYDPKYIEAFKLELAAVKKVRQEFQLKNLNVMIPFVRTVAEADKVTNLMAAAGLHRGPDFKVYMMAEIPSNIILADQFNKYVDGYSIGSNDLAMLILGCDRNNDTVAHLFDERNLAVKRAISHLIKAAHQDNKTVSICGQAPSEYPELASFLIQQGIDYISVNPDMVKETKQNVARIEQRIILDNATGKGRQAVESYAW